MKESIRVANGQGFWGDSIDAPRSLLKYGKIDYLTLDYLAEVTLSIMQKQRLKNPDLGYAKDFVDLVVDNVNHISDNKIKIISNAGGVNPNACRKKILDLIPENSLKIAIVKGDDIYNDLDKIIEEGHNLNNMYTNEKISKIKKSIYSANVYIDSFSVADALSSGADIILCGRISDPGLVVAPCIYEFNWNRDDYDKLASATVAGHIVECGAQCTGGNYTDWQDLKDLDDIGYPIAEIESNGEFIITKPEDTGGIINRQTITEQILYELGDPRKYISPDVCVDFTSFKLIELDNSVKVVGVRGMKPTDTYKVSISYFNGYKASGQLTVSGPDAIKKAKVCSDIILNKLNKKKCVYDETRIEFLGVNSCHQDIVGVPNSVNELVLRISVRSNDKLSVEEFTKELSPLITAGPPGITGFAEGRPRVREVVAFWPSLLSKSLIKTKVDL